MHEKANMNGRVKWLAGIPIAIKDRCSPIDLGIGWRIGASIVPIVWCSFY